MFPDAAPLHLSRIQLALERAGLVTEHVEGFGADYATTLTHWLRRPRGAARRRRAAGRPGARARLAALPARGAQAASRRGFMSIYQVLGRKP